jgi:hypothetical protein
VYGDAHRSVASVQLRFDVTMPGLWSAAMPTSPPQLRGLLRRTEVQCDGKALAALRDATLYLSGDKFVWRRQTAAGCDRIETGTLTVDSTSASMAFSFDSGTSDSWSFTLDRAGNDITGLWLESYELSDCNEASYGKGREHYVLEPGSESRPPDLAGGCAATH